MTREIKAAAEALRADAMLAHGRKASLLEGQTLGSAGLEG
jgi:hypothetical protein